MLNASGLHFGKALQLGGAVGAAHSLDGDFALAVGTHLGGGLLRLGGLSVQGVDKLDHNEQHKGNDEEVDDGEFLTL